MALDIVNKQSEPILNEQFEIQAGYHWQTPQGNPFREIKKRVGVNRVPTQTSQYSCVRSFANFVVHSCTLGYFNVNDQFKVIRNQNVLLKSALKKFDIETARQAIIQGATIQTDIKFYLAMAKGGNLAAQFFLFYQLPYKHKKEVVFSSLGFTNFDLNWRETHRNLKRASRA